MVSVPVLWCPCRIPDTQDTEIHTTSVLPAHGGLLAANDTDPTPTLLHEDDGIGTERYRKFHEQQSTVLIYTKETIL